MKSFGEIALFVRIGEFMALISFLVVMSLVVDRVPRTTFLDRQVKAILLPQRKIVSHDAPPVVVVVITLRGTIER